MAKMQNFFKFGRIFSVKLQNNPSWTWQQCEIYGSSSTLIAALMLGPLSFLHYTVHLILYDLYC
jgi:hypothetical protein